MSKLSEEAVQALAVFGVGEQDPLLKAKQTYLQKTRENKFRRVIAGNKLLIQDFSRLQSNYSKLLNSAAGRPDYSDLNFENSEELFIYFFNLGVYALINGDYLKANEYLQQAYNINKQDALLSVYLGMIFMMRSNYQIAEKFFEDALRIDPASEDALYYAGDNFRRAGLYFKTLEYWEKLSAKGFSSYEVSFKIKEIKLHLAEEERQKKYAKYPFYKLLDKLLGRYKK